MRLVWWKSNQLFFHLPTIIELTPEIKCICYPDSSYGSLLVYYRYPEWEEMKFIENFVRNRDIVIDVGANIGDQSLLSASRAVHGHVHAFEPSPLVIPRLQENITLNNLHNRISINRQAASDHDGSLLLARMKTPEIDHILSPHEAKRGTLKIPCIKLDTYCTQNKIKHINLLKIDVEGAELLVLRGFAQYLEAHRCDCLVVEINTHAINYGYTREATIIFLKQLGYKIYVLNIDGKLRRYSKLSNESAINIVAVAPTSRAKKRVSHLL